MKAQAGVCGFAVHALPGFVGGASFSRCWAIEMKRALRSRIF